ncbi:lactate racemase domain-containing protein [Planctomycetaceae bacterium SH139]
MPTYFAEGNQQANLSTDDLRRGLETALEALGKPVERMLVLPPDYTRLPSRAGELTALLYQLRGPAIADIMPALGTHKPMPSAQIADMFPGVPESLFRPHRWRDDIVTLGEVPAEFVSQVTEGIYCKPWPAQVNRLLIEGKHDLIVSIGQVVPHEVIGMANYNKNVFVGTGGAAGINESHFLSAAYGMERTMGRANTPLRKILNYAQDHFCQDMPLLYVLTVIESLADGQLITRGLFIGDDHATFEMAAELSALVNVNRLDKPPEHVVAYLDPSEFHSTWLGNKAIYRTRMAIKTGGRLTVIAPAVEAFGEDEQIDMLIRKYGYRPSAEVLQLCQQHADLAANPSAAAHLIHGSPENRFEVFYGAGKLSREEIESVNYQWVDCDSLLRQYDLRVLQDGWQRDSKGEEFYFIRNPSLGLWMADVTGG